MNELQLELDKRNVARQELAQIFEAAGPEVKMTAEQVAEVKRRSADIDAMTEGIETMREIKSIADRNAKDLEISREVKRTVPTASGSNDLPAPTPEVKSVGDLFVESKAYRAYVGNRSGDGTAPNFAFEAPYDVKTLMTTSAGFTPQAVRTGTIIDSAQQMPKVVDLVPSTTTDQVAVVFMRETTYTSGAVEVAEGNAYSESAFVYSEISSPVRKIGVILPVTDEQLADTRGMSDRLNNRLTLQVRQRIDNQLVNGDGTGVTLIGFLNTPSIQTQAKTAGDTGPDAVFKALTKIQNVAFADPSGIIMNPTDWQNIRLMRTADGIYVFGPPSDSVSARLWGLPVATTTYIAAGTALCGDFAGYTEIAYKASLDFEVSNSHTDYFGKGILAIRGQVRAALVVYRPAALCSVTSL